MGAIPTMGSRLAKDSLRERPCNGKTTAHSPRSQRTSATHPTLRRMPGRGERPNRSTVHRAPMMVASNVLGISNIPANFSLICRATTCRRITSSTNPAPDVTRKYTTPDFRACTSPNCFLSFRCLSGNESTGDIVRISYGRTHACPTMVSS